MAEKNLNTAPDAALAEIIRVFQETFGRYLMWEDVEHLPKWKQSIWKRLKGVGPVRRDLFEEECRKINT